MREFVFTARTAFKIIIFPAWLFIIIIACIRMILFSILNYIAYGGEQITYNKYFNPKTIQDLFMEKINEEQTKKQSK